MGWITSGPILVAAFLAPAFVFAQISPAEPADSIEPAPAPIEPLRQPAPVADDRIMGVIPNFQTVSDPNAPVAPLRVRDKWKLFAKETVDPFNVASAALGAVLSQAGDSTPKYGNGFGPYSQRFGAAMADLTTQSFFSDAVFASAFHEDPRYFRRGPEYPVLNRVFYSMSRILITRRDDGRQTFNFAGVLGMAVGIALSNSYYPSRSISGSVTEGRFITSVTGASLGNLLPEFWPDIKQKLARRKHRKDPVVTSSLNRGN